MSKTQLFTRDSQKIDGEFETIARFREQLSIQPLIHQLEKMRRVLLGKGVAPKGIRLEICKVPNSNHFMQAYWRSPVPIFLSRRDGSLVKRRYLGRVGCERHRQAELEYRRRLSVNEIDRRLAQLRKQSPF